MKIFRFLLFVLLAIFSGASFAQQPAIFWLDQTARDKIIDASGSIIQEIDSSVLSGNYSRIYGNASSVIKLAINQQDYSDRLAKLRFTLNSPSDRVLQSVEGGFTYLPNRPEGEYVLVTYDVKFWGNNNIFTEQLILKRESNSSDDSWSLASPNPPLLSCSSMMGFEISRRALLSLALASSFASLAKPASHKVKVVVFGGGIGGTTFIRSMQKLLPESEIILVEKNKEYTCCFKSNEYLFDLRPQCDITRNYDDLSKVCTIVNGVLSRIEPNLAVLEDGQRIDFDFGVVATGVNFEWSLIEGYTPGDEMRVPHSWGGEQSLVALKKQVDFLPRGGVIVITTPSGPYKCPPGPYERASLAAHFVKERGLRAKVLICDSGNAFPKQTHFAKQWIENYAFGTQNSIIEWLPASEGGKLAMLNTAASEITLQGGEKIEYDVANIIPRQSAGKVLAQSGLVDDSGWCPVDGLTMESSRLKSLYVIGDCAAVGDMPKSAFSAIGQAHHCALNLLMQITGQPLVSPKLMNVCYSLVAANAGISISHRFRYDSPRRRIALENVELSPLMASRDELYWECQQSENWFRLVTEQAFGSHLYEFS